MNPCTLYEVLATVPDPRSRRGRIHPLPAFMGLVALALLMGRKSLKSIARFGRQHKAPLAHALGFRRGRIDTVAFEQISLDGKTLRGSHDGEIPGQHLVAAYASAVEAVLGQIRVDSKTNEHKAALELLGILPLKGKIVVGDAMFCQRDLAEQVVNAEGDYLLVVKDNQRGLEIDIQAGFAFEQTARGIAAATSP